MQEASAITAAQPIETAQRAAKIPIFTDPAQTRLTARVTTLCIALALLLFAASIIIAVMWYRGPIVVFMRQTPKGDEVVAYNGRPVSSANNTVIVGQDVISQGNKMLIARTFVENLYGSPDAGTRAVNVQKALRMMVDASADKLIACLKRGCTEMDLNLAEKRAQGTQEQWTEQEATIDPRDPFMLNIIGQQKSTKTINNEVVTENKQLRFSIKLVIDPEGRTPRNLENGVRVAFYDYKVLNQPTQ